jgi:hypothetical protein
VPNKQEEIFYVLRKKYEAYSGTVLFEDETFVMGNEDDVKDHIFYHVNKNKLFNGQEEFFTTKEMITLCNWSQNKIHFWLMNDQYEKLDFQQKIQDVKDSKNYAQ